MDFTLLHRVHWEGLTTSLPTLVEDRRQMWVYLITAGEHVKVGISRDPRARIASLATASPIIPELAHAYPSLNARDEERILHDSLAEAHIHREWFSNTPFVMRAYWKGASKAWRARAGEVTRTASDLREQIAALAQIADRLEAEAKVAQSHADEAEYALMELEAQE